ncbi:MAG: twin-arginine translocase subunit TatC [Bacteroidales bacterium]|nr:twin-arginine translocase subunit TatC [Bacteroidales bacterium]
MTFWEHLDELRGCIIRIVVGVGVAGIAAFCFKDLLFKIVLWPQEPDFPVNALMNAATGSEFQANLINIDLAQQFLTHVKVAMWMGLLVAMPYVVIVLFRYVSPALYSRERRYVVRAAMAGYLLFMSGVALNYFAIFPITFRFLASYQVSPVVQNAISLPSYIGALLVLSLMMGLVFELPVLCWLLAKIGVLRGEVMRKYRRHAIVIVVIVSAVITPTGDPFTLTIVALPIYLLYEASIVVVNKAQSRIPVQQGEDAKPQ